MKREYKTLPFELEALDYEGRTITGYASTFGNTDLGGDVIHKGAFAKTLAERGNKVRFLWQHNPHEPLGKPLEMREDDRGLYIKAVISDTARGRDALALLQDGAISGLSIGYDAIGTDMGKADEGDTVRNLREIRLWEFSLVTFPMNESAEVLGLKADMAHELEELFDEYKQRLIDEVRAALEEAPTAPAKAGREENAADDDGAEPPKALTPEQEAELKSLRIKLEITEE